MCKKISGERLKNLKYFTDLFSGRYSLRGVPSDETGASRKVRQRLFRGKLMSIENGWNKARDSSTTTTPLNRSFLYWTLGASATTRTSPPSLPTATTGELPKC